MTLEPWPWAPAVPGAFIAGRARNGSAGLGILWVALLTDVLPAKAATGLVLPSLT